MTEKRKPDRSGQIEPPAKAKPVPAEQKKLDKALADSFPASDPVTPSSPTGDDDGPRGRIDRQTPRIDKELVEELAREVRRKTV